MNIGNTTCVLTELDTTKTVQSLVMSRLDYCNAFPIGIQRDLIAKLQRLQNSAARIVSWGKWEVVNITCAFRALRSPEGPGRLAGLPEPKIR